MMGGEWLEYVSILRFSELTAESFSRDWIDTLRNLACNLEPAILGEALTWFVHDECDMSDGHEESATTKQGDALIWLRSSLRNLADRLSDVVKLQEAEQLAEKLKQ